jgi:hypothetical protein
VGPDNSSARRAPGAATESSDRAANASGEWDANAELAHLVEPMLTGMTTARDHLVAWVHARGLATLDIGSGSIFSRPAATSVSSERR